MRKTRLVEVVEFYCDVCGSRCGSHVTYTEAGGKEHHACLTSSPTFVGGGFPYRAQGAS